MTSAFSAMVAGPVSKAVQKQPAVIPQAQHSTEYVYKTANPKTNDERKRVSNLVLRNCLSVCIVYQRLEDLDDLHVYRSVV